MKDEIKVKRRQRIASLPSQCENMKQLEAIYGIPKEMTSYFKGKGCLAFAANSRVDVVALLKFAQPTLRVIFCNSGANVEAIQTGGKITDVDDARTQCLIQDNIEKIRNNARENGLIHTLEEVETLIGEPLQQIFNELKNFKRNVGQKMKNILGGADVDPEITRQTIAAAAEWVESILKEYRKRNGLDDR